MATLWNTFSFWEQLLFVAIAFIAIVVVAGWVLSVCADAFDEDLPP